MASRYNLRSRFFWPLVIALLIVLLALLARKSEAQVTYGNLTGCTAPAHNALNWDVNMQNCLSAINNLFSAPNAYLLPEVGVPNAQGAATVIWDSNGVHRLAFNTNNTGQDLFVGQATTDTFTNKTFDTAGSGNSFRVAGNVISSVAGSGSTVVLQTSPAFLGTPTAPTAGTADATTQIATDAFVKNNLSNYITATRNVNTTSPITGGGALSADLTIACATCAVTSGTLGQFSSTSSTALRGIISDPTGTGSLVFATSPTLVTPVIGAATGTSLSLTAYSIYSNNLLSAPPAGSAAGETRVATLSNNFVISQNAKVGGLYYPPGAYALRVHRGIVYGGSPTSIISNLGDSFTATATSAAAIAAAGSEPALDNFPTSTVSGNTSGINGNKLSLPGRNIWLNQYWKMPALTNVRYFGGLTDGGLATQLASDAPTTTASYAGFVFTTDAATVNGTTFDSTHVYCIENNASTGPTIVNSNFTADTAGHYWDIREDSTNATWKYYIDGTLVCTITTTLPTTAQQQLIGVETLTTVAANLHWSWTELWSDK